MQISEYGINIINFYNKNSVIVKEKNILGNRCEAKGNAEWIEKRHRGRRHKAQRKVGQEVNG
jgi:hypothetical protein